MTTLALQYNPDVFQGPCGLCDRPTSLTAGPQLILAGKDCPVCLACGRQAAPALAALVGLASAAERVGRINRHTVTPPLPALMELARAAESYAGTAPVSGSLAGGDGEV